MNSWKFSPQITREYNSAILTVLNFIKQIFYGKKIMKNRQTETGI